MGVSMKKRERLEVIYDILKIISASNNSIKITPLIRKANLSTTNFNTYYEELLNKGLIREITGVDGKFITLTDKGFLYLQKYKLIQNFIQDFEL